MIDLEPFKKLINDLEASGKYRVFNDILRERGEFPNAIWYGKYAIKNIVNWCSNAVSYTHLTLPTILLV